MGEIKTQKNKTNLYGFNVKYVVPNVLDGRPIRKARVFYEDAEILSYAYKKRQGYDITFISEAAKNAYETMVHALHMAYQTPDDGISFLMLILSHVQAEDLLRGAKEHGADGLALMFDANGKFVGHVPYNEPSSEYLLRAAKLYGCKTIKKVNTDKQFIIEEGKTLFA